MESECLKFTPISEMNLSFSSNEYTQEKYVEILKCIGEVKPMISVGFSSFLDTNIDFSIYYLNNNEDIEDFYCTRTSIDEHVEGIMLYQLFLVKVKSLDMLNDFWLTSEADLVEW